MSGLRVRRTAVLLVVLFGLAACSRPPPIYHEQFLAFGTIIDLSLWGVDDDHGRRAARLIRADFERMHETWHAWHPGPLNDVNQQLARGDTFVVPPSILPLLRQAQTMSTRTGGLFNPALGELIRLWGFASDDPPQGPPPSDAQIEALLAQAPGMDDIVLDGLSAHTGNPAVRLDFGGFAKGYGVDLAIEHLRELGIDNAIVNAGGNLRAIGRHGDRPWRIGIRNPRGEGILASVEVEGDESVFTSGDYERYFDYAGQRYHHILDPRSGYPARGVIAVTVFHNPGADADAASTALMIAGVDGWHELARTLGVAGVMLVAADGTIHLTPSLKDRIQFIEPVEKLVVSKPL